MMRLHNLMLVHRTGNMLVNGQTMCVMLLAQPLAAICKQQTNVLVSLRTDDVSAPAFGLNCHPCNWDVASLLLRVYNCTYIILCACALQSLGRSVMLWPRSCLRANLWFMKSWFHQLIRLAALASTPNEEEHQCC